MYFCFFFLKKKSSKTIVKYLCTKKLECHLQTDTVDQMSATIVSKKCCQETFGLKTIFFCLSLMTTSTIVNKSFQRVLFQDFFHSEDLTFLLVFTIHWIMFSSVWNMLIQLKIIAGSRLLRTAQRSSRGIHQHHRKSFCKRPPLGRLLKIAGHHYLLEE